MYDNLTRTNLEFAYQKAEKRIAELEKKLEQTEKDLADYQFNYPTIKELSKELEIERKLNAEIKARFVKCNTCTPDMKEKCPMFHENLCEGERCEELVDLMSLVEKRDTDDKLTKAKEIIRNFIECFFYLFEHDDKARGHTKINDAIEQARQFLEE